MPESPAVDAIHWILTLVCEDRPGIVHAISGAIVEAGGNITESQQFSSDDTGTFFMRLQVETAAGRDGFATALAPVTKRFGMQWQLDVVGRPLRTLVLASTAAHALNDLLFRQRGGQLPVDIPLVLANHPDLGTAGRLLGRALRMDAGDRPRAEGGLRAPRPRCRARARHRARGARPLHADPLAGAVRRSGGAGHQHPPFLPPRVQGREPLQAGARPRREADRGRPRTS